MLRFRRICLLAALMAVWLAPTSLAGAGREVSEADPDTPVKKYAERERLNTGESRKRAKTVARSVARAGITTHVHGGHSVQSFVANVHSHRMVNRMNGFGTSLRL
jgi:hypothetical protein